MLTIRLEVSIFVAKIVTDFTNIDIFAISISKTTYHHPPPHLTFRQVIGQVGG